MTRGPKPKDNAIRRNVHEYAQVIGSAAQPGRELPRGLGITTAGARRFWRTWATAPQTKTWAETDWAELEITVKLVDAFYQGETKHAGEIRQRVAKWGATTEDRSRLRMSLNDDQNEGQGASAEPSSTSEAQEATDMDEALYRLLSESP